MLTEQQAKKLIEKVLSYSKAGECGVTVGARHTAQIRFANNSITTSGRHSTVAVNIAVTNETRTGRVALVETSDEALRAAVARAEELSRFAPPNPEFVPALGPQKYSAVDAFDEKTAAAAQAELLPGVRAAVEGARAKDLVAAGYTERAASSLAVGNKRGNFGYATRTRVEYSLTVRTPDGTGSGWAAGSGVRLSDFDPAAVAREAIGKSVLSQKPRRLEAGRYTVVLEPVAAADLMDNLFGFPLSARAAEEGRSVFTKKGGGTLVGEKLFAEKINARTDPFDARNPGAPWVGNVRTEIGSIGGFFFGGGAAADLGSFIPNDKVTWIEKGVLKNLAYDRYWAQKQGVAPTPAPNSIVIEGEDRSLDDLIASTQRGLLVTRFWYIRTLNPQTVQLTGLTRDGVFLIEGGKVVAPVNNFRWNESPASALARVEMLSRPVRAFGAESSDTLIPAMKIHDFNMASVSEAV